MHKKASQNESARLSAVRMGLEPTTSGVTGPHSNQLNYRTRSFAVFDVFLKRGCKVRYIF